MGPVFWQPGVLVIGVLAMCYSANASTVNRLPALSGFSLSFMSRDDVDEYSEIWTVIILAVYR